MGAFLKSRGILIKESEMKGLEEGRPKKLLRCFCFNGSDKQKKVLRKINGITKIIDKCS
jgi:hypothetical protein